MKPQNRRSHLGKQGSAAMELRLLGPLLVQVDGAPVKLAARKARGLLAYLALRRGETVPRETLAGLLWSERGEEQARASLRQTLSALRKALGDARAALVASNESITLVGEAVWIDVEALQGCAETTSRSLATEAALKEAGADYEIVPIDIKAGEQHQEEYGCINPRRQVPALVLPDGSIMTEGAAILLHIADAHPQSRLAPPPGSSERAQHDRWLFFFAVNV